MKKKYENFEQPDIVDIYIQTTTFIRQYYKIISLFIILGFLFGWIYYSFSTPKYNTFFLTKNGNLENRVIKTVLILNDSNITDLTNNEYDNLMNDLKPVESIIADTAYMNGYILFRVAYKGNPDLNKIQAGIVKLFSHNNIVVDYIKNKKNRIIEQKDEIAEFIALFKKAVSTTDTVNQSIRFKLLTKNLSDLLKQKSELNIQYNETGNFTVLTPIVKPEHPILTRKDSIFYSVTIFFILGISFCVLLDLNKRAKERRKLYK